MKKLLKEVRFQWRLKADTRTPTSRTSTAKAAVRRAVMAAAIAVLAGVARAEDVVATVVVVDAARAGKENR